MLNPFKQVKVVPSIWCLESRLGTLAFVMDDFGHARLVDKAKFNAFHRQAH